MKYTQVHQEFLKYFYSEVSICMYSDLIIATSGGQDSLALFKLMKDFQDTDNYNIHVTHCNHKWRNDSLDNSRELHYLTQYWGAYFHYYTSYTTLINELDARKWRYETLIKLATKMQACQILIAHTLTDKVETFLYNLMRRYSIENRNFLLPLIYLTHNIQLLRPLINISRIKTYWLCQLNYLPIWSDYTNYFLEKKRNRIRYEFLPYIKNHFSTQIESQLNSSFNLLKLQSLYINSIVNNFLKLMLKQNRNKIKLNISLIDTLPLILQYQVLKHFILYCFKAEISKEVIKKIICQIYRNKLPYFLTYKKHTIQIDKKCIYYHNI
uniref:tRNA(Ile)-lysidine synthase n=1 Tax=Sciadococcus taiwanensis TaxID=3028030 RepID=A0A9Y1MXB3_9RHOD|nr:tRNA(Ile)-lysidine synthetase [Sciadococcus taiwanensis]